MNKKAVKILSFFIAVITAVTALPISVFADSENESADVNSNIIYSGSNPISKAITESQADNYDNDGFLISAVEFDGNTARVQAEVSSDCSVIAALYDEDSGRMLASGKTSVTRESDISDSIEVYIDTDGISEDYYVIKAFLVNGNNEPLCKAFETKEYTKAFAEFYAKKPSDYDSGHVKVFTNTEGDDFFAVNESAVIINGENNTNRIVTADDENMKYVISNPSKELKKISIGDILFYNYGDGDNDYILIKVKSVGVSFSEITVRGDDSVELYELFEHIKIDEEAKSVSYDESGAYDGLIITDESSASAFKRTLSANIEADNSLKKTYTLDKKFGPGETCSIGLKLSLAVSLRFKLFLDIHIFSPTYYYIESVLSYDMSYTVALKLSGALAPEVPLGSMGFEICGTGAVLELCFVIEADISVSFKAKMSRGCIGFAYEAGTGKIDKSKSPESDFTPDSGGMEINIFAGLKAKTSVALVKIAEVSFEAKCGAAASGKNYEMYIDENTKHESHDVFCLDCKFGLAYSVSFKINVEKLINDTYNYDGNVNLFDFYYSADGTFGKGDCPHKLHRITYTVKETNGEPIAGASVNGSEITDENGIAEIFLPDGSYEIDIIAPDGRMAQSSIIIYGSSKNVEITLEPGNNSNNNLKELLLGYVWYNKIQSDENYQFFDNGTVKNYFPGDDNNYYEILNYELDGDTLTLNGTKLKYVSKNDPIDWKTDLFFYNTVYDDLKDGEMFFYETDYVDDGSPSDNVFWLRIGEKINTNTDKLPDTFSYNGHSYKVYDNSMTWSEVKEYCENIGGHLATITTADEQAFIESIIKNGTKSCYWLGGTDENSEGDWTWITGEEFSYTHWGSDMPDNYLTENYLMIFKEDHPVKAGNTFGYWNDLKEDCTCSGTSFFRKAGFGFICEWDNDNGKTYMETLTPSASDRYTGNMGDSCIGKIGIRNGTAGVTGKTYTHGLEAWIARWNGSNEISWAWNEYNIDKKYDKLSGCIDFCNYSIDGWDYTKYPHSTLFEIIGDGATLYSVTLDSNVSTYPIDFDIDVEGVSVLRISFQDLTASKVGSSFILGDLALSKNSETENQADAYSGNVKNMYVKSADGKKTAYLDKAENGADYLFVAVKDKNAEDLLDSDNLLFIDQVNAQSEIINVSYFPRSDESSYFEMFIGLNCGVYIIDKNNTSKDPTDPNNPDDSQKFVIKGDMNGDGAVTAADARLALRIAARLDRLDEYTLLAGDLDSDGKITSSEARKILRVAARLDRGFE